MSSRELAQGSQLLDSLIVRRMVWVLEATAPRIDGSDGVLAELPAVREAAVEVNTPLAVEQFAAAPVDIPHNIWAEGSLYSTAEVVVQPSYPVARTHSSTHSDRTCRVRIRGMAEVRGHPLGQP